MPKERKSKVSSWSGEQLGAFLDHAAAHPLGPVFELMAITGLRRGEALGLRWQDVQLSEGYIVVREQVVQIETAKGGVQAPGP